MKIKTTLWVLLLIAFIPSFTGCSKNDNPGKNIELPVTVSFANVNASDPRDFTVGGIHFQSGSGGVDWRSGNCAVNYPAQPLIIAGGSIRLVGANTYTNAGSLVADVEGMDIHKVIVKMYAADAFDPITMRSLPSAYVTLCDGNNVLTETREMASQTTDGNGQVVQTWELDAGGSKAKRLIITSDEANVFSVTIE